MEYKKKNENTFLKDVVLEWIYTFTLAVMA